MENKNLFFYSLKLMLHFSPHLFFLEIMTFDGQKPYGIHHYSLYFFPSPFQSHILLKAFFSYQHWTGYLPGFPNCWNLDASKCHHIGISEAPIGKLCMASIWPPKDALGGQSCALQGWIGCRNLKHFTIKRGTYCCWQISNWSGCSCIYSTL